MPPELDMIVCLPSCLPSSADPIVTYVRLEKPGARKNLTRTHRPDLKRSYEFSLGRSENPRVGGSTPSPGTIAMPSLSGIFPRAAVSIVRHYGRFAARLPL